MVMFYYLYWIFMRSLLCTDYCYGHGGHKDDYATVCSLQVYYSVRVVDNLIDVYSSAWKAPFIHLFSKYLSTSHTPVTVLSIGHPVVRKSVLVFIPCSWKLHCSLWNRQYAQFSKSNRCKRYKRNKAYEGIEYTGRSRALQKRGSEKWSISCTGSTEGAAMPRPAMCKPKELHVQRSWGWREPGTAKDRRDESHSWRAEQDDVERWQITQRRV